MAAGLLAHRCQCRRPAAGALGQPALHRPHARQPDRRGLVFIHARSLPAPIDAPAVEHLPAGPDHARNPRSCPADRWPAEAGADTHDNPGPHQPRRHSRTATGRSRQGQAVHPACEERPRSHGLRTGGDFRFDQRRHGRPSDQDRRRARCRGGADCQAERHAFRRHHDRRCSRDTGLPVCLLRAPTAGHRIRQERHGQVHPASIQQHAAGDVLAVSHQSQARLENRYFSHDGCRLHGSPEPEGCRPSRDRHGSRHRLAGGLEQRGGPVCDPAAGGGVERHHSVDPARLLGPEGHLAGKSDHDQPSGRDPRRRGERHPPGRPRRRLDLRRSWRRRDLRRLRPAGSRPDVGRRGQRHLPDPHRSAHEHPCGARPRGRSRAGHDPFDDNRPVRRRRRHRHRALPGRRPRQPGPRGA